MTNTNHVAEIIEIWNTDYAYPHQRDLLKSWPELAEAIAALVKAGAA